MSYQNSKASQILSADAIFGAQKIRGRLPVNISELYQEGDGIDQDDMISFLGLHNAGLELGTGIGNAPRGIRADLLFANGTRLRYVSCPFAPFLDSADQTPCSGK